MTATYDDRLLVHYAQNILQGNWLGEYTPTTLSKGVTYSLFMALANKLNVSYGLLFGCLNIFASSVVSLAFRPIVKNNYYLWGIYLYFLFSPIGFTHEYSTRIYRNALVIPAVEIVVACLLAIYYRKYSSFKVLFPWFAGLAIFFPFYWFIREDSIWLLPFTVAALAISLIQMILGPDFSFKKKADFNYKNIQMKKAQLSKISLFLLPLLSFTLVYQGD
nr:MULTISPECIES: hypothetical protein [unclassified Enterococcus]